MLLFIAGLVLAIGLGLQSGQVLAHHSFAAEFDSDVEGELTAVITQVRYSNPHVRYRADVTMPDGSVEDWELQAASVTSLRSQGWLSSTVEVGDSVTVRGQMGRNGTQKIFIRGLRLADGTRFGNYNEQAGATNDRNVVTADPDTDYGWGQQNAAAPFDISGPWRQGYKFRVTVDDLEPKPTPFTAQGRRIFEQTTRFDDPALRCISLGLPRLFGNPYNMSIYDAGNHYLFQYVEHNSARRIWMDDRQPDSTTPLTSNGFSVGHWEGDSLVIETTHLLPGWLDGSGLPMSGGDDTRLVERLEFREDRLAMDRTMTVHDALYTEPLTRVRGAARGDDIDISEQASCDPASYYVDLLENGLIEEYLAP